MPPPGPPPPLSSSQSHSQSSSQNQQQPPSRSFQHQQSRPGRLTVPTTTVNTVLPFNSSHYDNEPSSATSATSFHHRVSTDGLVSGGHTTTVTAPSPGGREDIEMDNINPSGHRRRRSTLTARLDPVNPSPLHTPISSAARSPRSDTDARISEEQSPQEDYSKAEKRTEQDDDSFSDEDLHDDEETGLSRKAKLKKQAKRRRNTRLDQRIVRDKISDEDRNEAKQNVYKKIATNAGLICLWYLFSLSISLYNKWMFDGDRLNFAFPLFTTSGHMLVQFSLACLVLYFVPSLRPQNSPHNSDMGASRHESEPQPLMTKVFYLTRIGPCGAATGLDIGLGNTSLKFITLTFYTMCKSSSLAFVLLFAFLFRLETPTWRLVGIIGAMTVGVVMMVAGEVQFELGGFILVIAAAFFSGFRWGLTQILLLRNPATSNPFSSIFFLAPIMFLTLFIIAIPVEGFYELAEGLKTLSAEWGAVTGTCILLFPGSIAFLMTASEFALLKRSSVVTLSIAGIFKEVVTISASTLIFEDTLTPVNISGLVVTIFAIGAYNWIKLSKMHREAQMDVYNKVEGYQSGPSADERGNSSDDDEDAGLLAHEEDHTAENSFITADGDIIPRLSTSPSDELRASRT